MIRRSNTPNRFLLGLIGVVLIIIGAVGIWPALSSQTFGLNLPDDGTTLVSIADINHTGVWIALAAAIVLGIIALWWILATLPRSSRSRTYFLHQDGTTGLSELSTKVLENAIVSDAETVAGVVSANATLGGTSLSPELTLVLDLDERADISVTHDGIYQQVLPNLELALETRMAQSLVYLNLVRQRQKSDFAVVAGSSETEPNGAKEDRTRALV